MEIVFNAVTGRFDLIGMTATEIEAYLKLDQTVPQSVNNGSPNFRGGITIKEGECIYLDGL